MIPARFFDGKSGKERDAQVRVQGNELIIQDNESQENWNILLDQFEVHLQEDEFILSAQEKELYLSKENFEKLQFKPKLLSRDKGPLLRGLIGAFIILTLGYFFYRPAFSFLAGLIPDSFFDSTAKQAISLYRPLHCLKPKQEEILGEIFRRLGKDMSGYELFVVKSTLVNAFVMPGNIIIIHDSLIKEVSGPDALAGIMAHEIAHLEKDHLKIGLIKHHLLGTFLAFVMGGTDNSFIQGISQGLFSQLEEREADTIAAEILRNQRVSPQGMVDFFLDRDKKDPAYLKYLSFTHPEYPERIKTFSEVYETSPVLSRMDWETLRKGCE